MSHTQFMLPMEKSVTFTGACANEIIPSINRWFFYKAKEGHHVRIINKYLSHTKPLNNCSPSKPTTSFLSHYTTSTNTFRHHCLKV